MKARVLVVDDEKDIRELIKFYLNKEGFEVLEAGDGEEALEIFENEYIDLGIIDVMMPVMDGFELVENLKEFKGKLVCDNCSKEIFKDDTDNTGSIE